MSRREADAAVGDTDPSASFSASSNKNPHGAVALGAEEGKSLFPNVEEGGGRGTSRGKEVCLRGGGAFPWHKTDLRPT